MADVDSLAVLFRADISAPTGAMSASARRLLDDALGLRLASVERTRTAAWRVTIDPPLSDAEARTVVDKLRTVRDVLYADPSVRRPADARVDKTSADDAFPTDQIIVRYRDPALAEAGVARADGARTSRVEAAAGIAAGYLRAAINGSHVYKLAHRVPHAEAEAIAARIAASPDVEYAEPDAWMRIRITPNDSQYANQWHYWDTYGINAPAAWDITTGSYEVVASVIDTGYRPHADLAGRILPGYDMIFEHLVANDGVPAQPGGCLPTTNPQFSPCIDDRDADASDPGDWITASENAGSDPTAGWFLGCGASNSSWHGTHVAGTIAAATNNASGVAGINWRTKVLPVRVLGKCGGYTSDIADAIIWASCGTVVGGPAGCAVATPSTGTATPVPNNPNRARVLNLSLGGGGACGVTYQTAINTAVARNTVVVIAAGNGNTDASNSSPGNCNGVITVAATGRQGQRASYSNYGSLVEIAAPRRQRRTGRAVDAQRGRDDTRRRCVCVLSGHQHGDAARRRRRIADALEEPVPHAGAGAFGDSIDRTRVPDRHRPRLLVESRGGRPNALLRRGDHRRGGGDRERAGDATRADRRGRHVVRAHVHRLPRDRVVRAAG